jgi:NAD-dependent DNA ligase
MNIQDLKLKIKKANDAYRIGKPFLADKEYDLLIDELTLLSPNDELLTKVGHIIADESRKSKLPIAMASMNKVKTIDEINDWVRLKEINRDEIVVITPKYDGLSLCVNERTQEAWTRGDGELGQKSDIHYKSIQNKLKETGIQLSKIGESTMFTYGEVMLPKATFIKKYSQEFANPRNLVAGLLNSKEISPILLDCNFIKYGFVTDDNSLATKSEMLTWLNKNQKSKVNFHLCKVSELTEDILLDLFTKWSAEYEIDGLVIEINNIEIQNNLGRETSSNNPVWARAFKSPKFEQSAEAEIIGISWNISKQGLLKPILHINPVKLDGVTVSNITGNNARFVKDMGLGIGAIITVKRSGMVIPIVSNVIKSVEFEMPNIPNIDWNDKGIELITLSETNEQKLKMLVAFFEILEAKNVSEGVITQLWNAGFKSIKDILNLKPKDMEVLEGFGKRKSTIVYNAIQESVKDITLSKLQHATGMFKGLGSKKLLLLEHFTIKPTIDQVMSIEGFAEVSAKSYINSYDDFFKFIKELPVSIKLKEEVKNIGNDLEGKNFVFTGVRRADIEKIIESRGGKIGSTVSKNTTHLIMKSTGSGSSKEQKAIELGIEIMTVEQLEILIN